MKQAAEQFWGTHWAPSPPPRPWPRPVAVNRKEKPIRIDRDNGWDYLKERRVFRQGAVQCRAEWSGDEKDQKIRSDGDRDDINTTLVHNCVHPSLSPILLLLLLPWCANCENGCQIADDWHALKFSKVDCDIYYSLLTAWLAALTNCWPSASTFQWSPLQHCTGKPI